MGMLGAGATENFVILFRVGIGREEPQRVFELVKLRHQPSAFFFETIAEGWLRGSLVGVVRLSSL